MLSIKVLGPGCANCDRLSQMTQRAIEEIKKEFPELEAEIERVTDRESYLDYHVLATPGLIVNEKLVSHGRVPSSDQIKLWVCEALVGGG